MNALFPKKWSFNHDLWVQHFMHCEWSSHLTITDLSCFSSWIGNLAAVTLRQSNETYFLRVAWVLSHPSLWISAFSWSSWVFSLRAFQCTEWSPSHDRLQASIAAVLGDDGPTGSALHTIGDEISLDIRTSLVDRWEKLWSTSLFSKLVLRMDEVRLGSTC